MPGWGHIPRRGALRGPGQVAPVAQLVQVDLRREFSSDAARADPRPVYARLRALGPVLRSKDLPVPHWLVDKREAIKVPYES